MDSNITDNETTGVMQQWEGGRVRGESAQEQQEDEPIMTLAYRTDETSWWEESRTANLTGAEDNRH